METDEKTKVLKLCTEFLDNAWRDVPISDIHIDKLTAGFANQTYHCSIKNCVSLPRYKETIYKDVIIRIYGSDLFIEKDTIKYNGESGEAIIIEILHEVGVGPKLIGVFSGGVIVEFIPSRTSNYEDWKDMDLCAAFARKLASLHSVFVPISKIPDLLERGLKIARSANKEFFDFNSCSEEGRKESECILSFPIEDEYEWLQKIIPKISSKVVFSHNDINPNNILFRNHYNSIDEQIVLIDFECCTYYHRAFDLAMFLTLKDAFISGTGKDMKVFIKHSDDNSREVIIKEYLKEIRRLKPNEVDETLDTFEHLSMEIELFELVYRIYVNSIFVPIVINKTMDNALSFLTELLSEYGGKKEAFVKKYFTLFCDV